MTEYKKTVVVTGASSGIGKAVAELYLSKGFCVIGLDRHKPTENSLFPTIICDIGDARQVEDAFSQIALMTDHLDYLINVAGVFYSGKRNDLKDIVLNDWTDTIRVNLTGTMLVIRNAIPLLTNAQSDRAIVNISSDQAFFPRKKNSAYAVSKFGVEGLTKACAVELLKDRIRVNAVAPASVKTDFILELAGSRERLNEIYRKEAACMPYGLIEAADIAETVFFFGSACSSKITGQTILVDSGKYIN